MFKLSSPLICRSLTLFLENCFASGHFPDVWKKSNIVPVVSSIVREIWVKLRGTDVVKDPAQIKKLNYC